MSSALRKSKIDRLVLRHPSTWAEITSELPAGTVPTLMQVKPEGVGVLQVSSGIYRGGKRPRVSKKALVEMLREFSSSRMGGNMVNITSYAVGTMSFARGDVDLPDEHVRVWYLSDGDSVALVTYVGGKEAALDAEMQIADRIVESAEFAENGPSK
jgi:hypothetical protein